MATVERSLLFDWTEQSRWLWPADDRKLIQVADYVADLDLALAVVDDRSLAIQAGGACGIWPKRLSSEFGTVLTFEPEPVNFTCLKHNCPEPNVIKQRAALGEASGHCHLRRNYIEDGNAGAWFTVPGNGHDAIMVLAIDDLEVPALTLLVLDVEGAEDAVLRGAARTIERTRPVIMLEYKSLPHAPHRASQHWLRGNHYRHLADAHRDQIWVPA